MTAWTGHEADLFTQAQADAAECRRIVRYRVSRQRAERRARTYLTAAVLVGLLSTLVGGRS